MMARHFNKFAGTNRSLLCSDVEELSMVILRSISRCQKDETSNESDLVAMDTQEEQYSPSDFINQQRTSSDGVSRLSGQESLSSSPFAITTQSVIRPIPILPLDASIYSSPPTYIDNLPPSLSVPMMQAAGIGCHLGKGEVPEVSIPRGHHSKRSFQRSQSCTDSMELYDCRWLNCDRQFTCMDDLVVHVNDHHVRVERADSEYQCKWTGCPRQGKGFNARYKMLIHIRTHTNEKPHKCALCGKSFSRLENLKIHMRSHTGEKPYTCPFEGCKKAYSNSSDRFKHVRTHQEDKPYICKKPGCDKRYTDPSSLRKHVRTHGHYVKEATQTSSKPSASPQHSSIINFKPAPSMFLNSSAKSVIVPICPPSSLTELGSSSVIHHTALHSNPLLSSAIIPIHRQTVSTQTENVVSSTSSPRPASAISYVDFVGKGQDSPLDLSTSSPDAVFASDADLVTVQPASRVKFDALPQDMVRWEVVHLAS